MSESDEPDNPKPRDPWAPPAEPASAAAKASDEAPPAAPALPSPPSGFSAPAPAPPTGFSAPVPPPAAPGAATPPPPPPPMGLPYPPYPAPPPSGYHGGYPGYPVAPYGAWPPPGPRNGFGTTAMVFGIIGVVLAIACIGAFLGLPLGIGAIILGVIGLRIANRGEATNRSQALTGLILGIVASLISAAMIAGILFGALSGTFDSWDTGSGSTISADRGDYGDPLSEDDTATYDDGLQVTVSAVQSTSALKTLTKGDSALTFTVSLVNHGDTFVDLSESEISAYADPDSEDTLQDLSTDKGLSGHLAPDASVSTTVIVVVPAGDDGSIELEIAPGYDYDYVYWDVAA